MFYLLICRTSNYLFRRDIMKRRTSLYAFMLFTLSAFALTGCSGGGGGGSGGVGGGGGGGNNPAPALTVLGRVLAPGGQVATKSEEGALETIVGRSRYAEKLIPPWINL
jgi:hypothetical protein